MKITVLGPWGAYPKAGEATAGYLLEHEGYSLLIDCGSGVLAQVQRYIPLNRLDAVIISHKHHDHVADLGCLQYACLIDTDLGNRSQPLPVYFAAEADKDLTYPPMMGTEIHRIEAGEKLSLFGLDFTFFKTFHEAYCVGMIINIGDRKLVYTADTYYDESLIAHCAEADVLIAETSFHKEIADARKYGHMNSGEVGRLANQARVKSIVLTHLPHFGPIDQLAAEVAENYEGPIGTAFCGMEILL
ncbi:MBL fold metallo-hydrolase [Paenibacillus sepulcri]|uniref:MBL fold metallo-hydrolase n=1 Tax=Paenibacillus sepulcri TaxID=359917 RepID=A0ABS7CC10_9BACL|nr:MBL fold metallo-hydrolase [Paenibacillus sepulcri]